MKIPIIYSDIHQEHNPEFEIYDGQKVPYAEKPERILNILQTLKNNGFKNIHKPITFPNKHILAVHQRDYVEFISNRARKLNSQELLFPSYFIMDTYTPIVKSTYSAARSSVDVALSGAEYLLLGEKYVYSLCRPPGHHAGYKSMGGYCYFNNSAIAANYLSGFGKVAILDIDFHHGNGTQEIFYDRSDVLYVSIHANPKHRFPYSSGFIDEIGRGKGEGYNINYPMKLGATNKQYLKILKKALGNIKNFEAKYLLVSGGFDTYSKDPIGGFGLTAPFYAVIAQEIAKLNLPTLIVQEGGYNIDDLGGLATNFIRGISRV